MDSKTIKDNFSEQLLQHCIALTGQQYIKGKGILNPNNPADTKPSCCLFKNKHGHYVLHDYGDGTQHSCIDTWQSVFKLPDFKAAVKSIEEYLQGRGGSVVSNEGFYVSNQTPSPAFTVPTYTVLPVATDFVPPPICHYVNGVPDHKYKYTNADGKTVGYVYRWDATSTRSKAILPVVWARHRSGMGKWIFKGLPTPRPVYRLSELLSRSDAPVIICEGERTAEVAAKQFPDYVCISWCGGAQAVRKTNWAPLLHRKVYLFPDNDEAGINCMRKIAETLTLIGCRIGWITAPIDFPTGWDAADYIPETGVYVDQSTMQTWATEAQDYAA